MVVVTFQLGKLSHIRVYQAFTFVTFADVLLAKASHTAKLSQYGRGLKKCENWEV